MNNSSNLNYEKLLLNAINKCSGMYVEDIAKDFQLLYPFTTENISGYINDFNLSRGNLLTVGSSGDQVINASLYGCSDITFLDICPYAKFYLYLKISALLELDKNEFLKFFCYKDYPKTFKDNKLSFNNNIFNNIKTTLRLLDYESYFFWDELFQTFKGLDIRKELFYFDEYKKDIVIECNPYLKSDIAYRETQRKIKKTKIDFINCNIFNTKLEKKFDSIWLSNIGTHLLSHILLKEMIDKVSSNLNDNAQLLISYLYNTKRDTKYKNEWSPIYNLEKTLEILDDYKPELNTFLGIDGIKFNDNTIEDSVFIYKKLKQ